jgi:hypothetical protein
MQFGGLPLAINPFRLAEKVIQPLEHNSADPAAHVHSEYGRIFVIWLVQIQFSGAHPAEPWAWAQVCAYAPILARHIKITIYILD